LMVYIQSTVGQEGTLSASTVQPTELLDPVGQQAVILAQQLLAEFQSLASDFGEAERIYDHAVAAGRDIFEDEDLSEANSELAPPASQPPKGPASKFCQGVPNAKPYTNMNCGCFRSYLNSSSWAGPLYNSKFQASAANPATGIFTQMPPSSSTYFPCLATAYMRQEKLPIRTGKCGKDIALGMLEKKTGKKIPANAAEAKAMAAAKLQKKTGIDPGGAKAQAKAKATQKPLGAVKKQPVADLGDILMSYLSETGSSDCDELREEAAKVQCYKEEAWKHLRQAEGILKSCNLLKKEAEKLKCIKTKAKVKVQALKEMKKAGAKFGTKTRATHRNIKIPALHASKAATAKVEAQAMKEMKKANAKSKDTASSKSRKKTRAAGNAATAKVEAQAMKEMKKASAKSKDTASSKSRKKTRAAGNAATAKVEAQARKEMKRASAKAAKIAKQTKVKTGSAEAKTKAAKKLKKKAGIAVPTSPAEAKEKATEKNRKETDAQGIQGN